MEFLLLLFFSLVISLLYLVVLAISIDISKFNYGLSFYFFFFKPGVVFSTFYGSWLSVRVTQCFDFVKHLMGI